MRHLKQRLSIDGHRAAGAELHRARNILLDLAAILGRHYPHRPALARRAREARRMVDWLRWEMEAQAVEDLGGQGGGNHITRLYCPGDARRLPYSPDFDRLIAEAFVPPRPVGWPPRHEGRA